jgi:hypothetical protein
MRALGILVLLGCTADVAGIEGRENEPMGGGSGQGSSDTSLTLSQYFDEIAQVHCDQAFLCRESFPPDLGYTFEDQWGASVRDCTQGLVEAWDPALVETEIAKGRIKYDGAAAASCLSGVTFAACPAYWERGIEWAESCYSVVVGMVPTGGVCDSSYSCTSYSCDPTTNRCL